MTITTSTMLPDAPEDHSRNMPASQAAPSTDSAAVNELCHILARIILRVNADQQTQTAASHGGAQ